MAKMQTVLPKLAFAVKLALFTQVCLGVEQLNYHCLAAMWYLVDLEGIIGDKIQSRFAFPAPRLDFGNNSPGLSTEPRRSPLKDAASEVLPNTPLVDVKPSNTRRQQPQQYRVIQVPNRANQGRRVMLLPGQSVPQPQYAQRVNYATRPQSNVQQVSINQGNQRPGNIRVIPRNHQFQGPANGGITWAQSVQQGPQPRPQQPTHTWAQPRPNQAVSPGQSMVRPTQPSRPNVIRVIKPPAQTRTTQNSNSFQGQSGKVVRVPQSQSQNNFQISQSQPPPRVIRPVATAPPPPPPTQPNPKPILVPVQPATPGVIPQLQPRSQPQPARPQPQPKTDRPQTAQRPSQPAVVVVNPPAPNPTPVYTVMVTARPPPSPFPEFPKFELPQPVEREFARPQPRERVPTPTRSVNSNTIQDPSAWEVYVPGGKMMMEAYPENFCDLRTYPDDQLAMRNLQRVEYFVANMSCSRYFFECAIGQTFMLNCTGKDQVFDIATVNCNYRNNVKSCPEYDNILHCTIKDQCLPDQYACCAAPQQCISVTQRCDGVPDCADGEDENNCPSCASDQFACPKSDKCIPISKRCDGVPDDCYDQTNIDEMNCGICAQHQFHCSRSNTCVDASQRCDGVTDCPNAEDELNCKTKGPKYLLCENQKQSVTKENWCNGIEDCLDGSDEIYCFYKKK